LKNISGEQDGVLQVRGEDVERASMVQDGGNDIT
jgi:hypothetical protein